MSEEDVTNWQAGHKDKKEEASRYHFRILKGHGVENLLKQRKLSKNAYMYVPTLVMDSLRTHPWHLLSEGCGTKQVDPLHEITPPHSHLPRSQRFGYPRCIYRVASSDCRLNTTKRKARHMEPSEKVAVPRNAFEDLKSP